MNTRALLLSTLLIGTFAAPAFAFNITMDGSLGASVAMSGGDLTGETLDSKDGPFIPAGTGEAAQSMISRLGEEAMGVIADANMDAAKKKQVFRGMLVSNFDMKKIGQFALGKFWREASDAQKAEYLKLYENMIINVYTTRFQNYKGQKFQVIDHRVDEASGDVIVNSTVTGGGAPVNVAWRVRPKGNSYKIIDVMVEGVSMAVTQRNDFAGVIQSGGNNITALLDYLRRGGTSDVD
ncbi:MAG TPA: ABC transporter substrate-binding protein [Alphaproteobacteria bacterium]